MTYGALPLLSFSAHPNLKIIKGDIRDTPAFAKVVKEHDYILHLAAIVGYPACAADPHLTVTTNVDGTRNLLEAMGKGQRLIFASTGFDLRQGGGRGDGGDSHRPADPLREVEARRRDAHPRLEPGARHPPVRHRLRQLAADEARPPHQRLRLSGPSQPADRPVRGLLPTHLPPQPRRRRRLSVRHGELRRRWPARSSTSATSR